MVYTFAQIHDGFIAKDRTLRLLINKALHLYDFELNLHVLSVLTGFEPRISAQVCKPDCPFQIESLSHSKFKITHPFIYLVVQSYALVNPLPMPQEPRELWKSKKTLFPKGVD